MIVINLLPKQYAEDCRIKGSQSVPFAELEQFVGRFPKNTKMVVYCAHYGCSLSAEGWKFLKKLGYTNVRAYEGGMREWVQKKLPTEGLCQLSYLREESKPPLREHSEVMTITAQELLKEMSV